MTRDGESPVRVVLSGPEIARRGFDDSSTSDLGYEVVGFGSDGEEVLRKLRGHRPQVLLLILYSENPNLREESMAQYMEASPDTKVVVICSATRADAAHVRQTMAAGALGYVVATSGPAELSNAIRLAAQGRPFVDSSVATALALEARDPRTEPTERELQVMELLALGYTNQEAADRLFLSARTIETIRGNINTKLGFARKADLVRHALETGLIHNRSHLKWLEEPDSAQATETS